MQRIIAISNCFGYYDKFIELLQKAEYNPNEDHLVILGDFIDQGPDSIKLLLYIRYLQRKYEKVTVLQGDHEEMFVEMYKSNECGKATPADFEHYSVYTGDDLVTFRAFQVAFNKDDSRTLIDWLDFLPLYHTIGEFIFVHGGVDSNSPINLQDKKVLVWGVSDKVTKKFYNREGYKNSTVIFGHTNVNLIHTDKNDYGKIWYDCERFDKICIHCGVDNSNKKAGNLAALLIELEDTVSATGRNERRYYELYV